METFINKQEPTASEGANMGKKVLIATLYNPEPVILASTRLGPDRLILLIDKEPSKEQEESLKIIQGSLGKVIDVKTVKTEVYDIVEVARKCVEIIDLQPKEDWIFVNITSGRKTKAIGLLFAAYARHDRVRKIAYNPEEDKSSVVYLPKLSFKLTESQKKILEALESSKFDSISDLAKKVDLSNAMLYRALDELKDMDLVSTDEGIKLTDAGKIARL
jgi:CRISPR locus-related DNA-binding protein